MLLTMTTEGETQGNRMLAYSDKKIKKADVHTRKDARAWTRGKQKQGLKQRLSRLNRDQGKRTACTLSGMMMPSGLSHLSRATSTVSSIDSYKSAYPIHSEMMISTCHHKHVTLSEFHFTRPAEHLFSTCAKHCTVSLIPLPLFLHHIHIIC